MMMTKALNKVLMLLVLAVAVSSLALAASVSRDMPSRVSPGETITVTFNVAGAEAGKLFTLEDDLPDTWKFASWEVSGAKEEKSAINHRAASGNRHGWSFTAKEANVKISYTAQVPSEAGSYDFDAVWFDPSGQSRDKKSIIVRTVTCGDTVCEGNENSDNCLSDCPKAAEPAPAPSPPEQEEPSSGKGIPTQAIIAVAAVALAIIAAGFLMMRKKK